MAKLDLKDAYHLGPVHPHDRPLLGMQWKEGIFIDGTLPFGLCSEPNIFSAVADGLMWMVQSQGFVHSLHCLDDFLFLGPSNSPNCEQALVQNITVVQRDEGPSTTLTFLGIEIDSGRGQLRLPQDKLSDLTHLLNYWMHCHHSLPHHSSPHWTGTKRDLLSLIELFNHAATIVHPGEPLRLYFDRVARSPCDPPGSSKGRHSMVAYICELLEWHIALP